VSHFNGKVTTRGRRGAPPGSKISIPETLVPDGWGGNAEKTIRVAGRPVSLAEDASGGSVGDLVHSALREIKRCCFQKRTWMGCARNGTNVVGPKAAASGAQASWIRGKNSLLPRLTIINGCQACALLCRGKRKKQRRPKETGSVESAENGRRGHALGEAPKGQKGDARR